MSTCLALTRLDNWFASIPNEEASRVFGGIGHLRKVQYRRFYPETFLPVEAVDFIATHDVLSLHIGERPRIVAAVRHVTLKRLDHYSLALPTLALARHAQNHRAIDALAAYCGESRDAGEGLICSSRYVVDGGDEVSPYRAAIREIVAASFFFEAQQTGITRLAGAAIPQLLAYYSRIGFVPLTDASGAVPPLPSPGKVSLHPIVCTQLTPWAEACYGKYARLFENRIDIAAGARETQAPEE